MRGALHSGTYPRMGWEPRGHQTKTLNKPSPFPRELSGGPVGSEKWSGGTMCLGGQPLGLASPAGLGDIIGFLGYCS